MAGCGGGGMEIVHHVLKNALIILLPKYVQNFFRAVALLESCILVWDGQKLWVNVQDQMPELWPVCLLLIQTTSYWGTGIALLEMSHIGTLLDHMD